jgi:hypothetical protein
VPEGAEDSGDVFRSHVVWCLTIIHRVDFNQRAPNIARRNSRKTTLALSDEEVAIAVARPRRAREGMILVHNDPQEYTRMSRFAMVCKSSGLGSGKISYASSARSGRCDCYLT